MRFIRDPSRARARSAGGVRSRKPNLGETVTLRTSWPARRGPRYPRSTSSSGISGIASNLTHGLTFAEAAIRLRAPPAGLHNLRPGRSSDGAAPRAAAVADDAAGPRQEPGRTGPARDPPPPTGARTARRARRTVAVLR